MPGAAEPERLFLSPRDDAFIQDVVASSRGYAFVETSEAAFGEGGWRLWYLAEKGSEPVELDRGEAPGAGAFAPPTLFMDEAHMAWTAFDEPGDEPLSRLRIAAIDDIAHATTLLESPARERQYWYPSISGEELWYAVIHRPPLDSLEPSEFHLESLDLSSTGSAPVRFGGIGNDFDPAVNERFVVWKTTGEREAAHNWGALHILDRGTNAMTAVPVSNVDRPSLGYRFVTFEEIAHARLPIYDLRTGKVIDLLPDDLRGKVLVGGESLSGNLLTFYVQRGANPPQIGWALLPE